VTDLAALAAFRRARHAAPELSGAEAETAAAFAAALPPPDTLLTGLGGHGVAAVYDGAAPGPAILIRAELDALPIAETGTAPWASAVPGVAHLCGHDGHLAILLGVARALARRRPARGRAILLAQPAEEDGSGAAAVLADPRVAALAPDFGFALHNLPGAPLGTAWLKPGPMNCASLGLRIVLAGRTAHAAEPESALSPAAALARLLTRLPALGPGGPLTRGFRLVTVTHARLGAAAFGIAPGTAEVWATLRTLTDDGMAALRRDAEALARAEAAADGLALDLSVHDDFAACSNHPQATAHLAAAIRAAGLPLAEGALPMRASEDFGRFAALCPTAMFALGAGEAHPRLHAPDYDFPDALLAPGVAVFERLLHDLLG
jgi:amidohydrolase